MSYLPQDREMIQSVHDFMSIVNWMKRRAKLVAWATGVSTTIILGLLGWIATTLWSVTDIPKQVTRLETRLDKFDERLRSTDVALGRIEGLSKDVDKLDQLRVLLAGMQDFPDKFQLLSKLPDALAKYDALPKELKDAQAAIPGIMEQIKKSAAERDAALAIATKSLDDQNKRLVAVEELINKILKPTSMHLIQVTLSNPSKTTESNGGTLFEFRVDRALQFLDSKYPGGLSVRNVELRNVSTDAPAPDDMAIDAAIIDGALIVSIWTIDKEKLLKMLSVNGISAAVQLAAIQ